MGLPHSGLVSTTLMIPGKAMKKIIIIVILVILIAAGAFVGYMHSSGKMMFQAPVLVQKNAKITFLLGKGYYNRTSPARWEQAIVGNELEKGYEVKTEANSLMDIRFHDDTAVKLSGNTHVKIEELTVRTMALGLQGGSMVGRFKRLFTKHSILVRTQTTVASIRGTELGFEVTEMKPQEKKPAARRLKDAEEEKPVAVTTVYSLSGITEVLNPQFQDQKVLLSHQNKLAVKEDEPPGNTEALTDEELARMRAALNAIHLEEVLFISDKINFNTGSAEILPSSYPELDRIVTIINEKNARIRIEGHTDDQGDEPFNQKLSVERATSIKAYFVRRGIEAEKLETAGYGESKPVADNKTEPGRALNRRVEFIVIGR
jgi:outer membrane protein OmpA-like peptidoglycan-associated protein